MLQGDFIDLKIVAAAAFLLLIAGIGVAYAAQWHPMMDVWVRFKGNSTNATGNSTEYQQFVQAVASNDYATAQQLHQQYGFGGKLFDKLNATTFSQLSQIYTLSTELRQELGITGQPRAFPYARGFVNGFRAGRFVGAHKLHGYINATNSSAT
jgi:hypothetical protein